MHAGRPVKSRQQIISHICSLGVWLSVSGPFEGKHTVVLRECRAYSVSVTLLLGKPLLLVLRLVGCVHMAKFKLCVLAMRPVHTLIPRCYTTLFR